MSFILDERETNTEEHFNYEFTCNFMRYPDKSPEATATSPKKPQLIMLKFETIIIVSLMEEPFYGGSCGTATHFGSYRAVPSDEHKMIIKLDTH